MTDHVITVLAVHVPDTQNPYAAKCSCGLTWQVPQWGEPATLAFGVDPEALTVEQTLYVAAAVDRAKATFGMWKDLHPTVPPPRPRKARDEVVRRLQTAWLGDLDEAFYGTESLAIAFCATNQEQSRAADGYMKLDPIHGRQEDPDPEDN